MQLKQSIVERVNHDVALLKKEKDVMSQHVSILKKGNDEIQKELDSITREFINIQSKCRQYEQENSQLSRKINFMERCETFKGSNSQIQIGRLSTTSNYLNSANIQQEDEVGEVFDNNFLSDLKTGGPGSQYSIDSTYSAAELQKRNSLYPQHMRASYAVCNVDFPLTEQEMKVRF